MKVCVFGAGALGGQLAARLIAAKAADVAVVARGAYLEAMRSRGLVVRSNNEEIKARVDLATDDPATLPPQDLLIVTLKAPALPAMAGTLARLIAPNGCALFVTNGIPWWWRHGLPGTPATLPLLDPDGALWSQVMPQRVLGCVVYAPTEAIEPGVILHRGPFRWILGEPDNSTSTRLREALASFQRAGIAVETSNDLRRDIWLKLVRNASNGTLSALIRQPLAAACDDPALQQIAAGLIRETLEVAAALGWDVRSEVDVGDLTKRADVRGGPRSSTLQDVLLGRPLEIAALIGQTQAFAREKGVAVPTIDVIVPLLRALDKSLARERRGNAGGGEGQGVRRRPV